MRLTTDGSRSSTVFWRQSENTRCPVRHAHTARNGKAFHPLAAPDVIRSMGAENPCGTGLWGAIVGVTVHAQRLRRSDLRGARA